MQNSKQMVHEKNVHLNIYLRQALREVGHAVEIHQPQYSRAELMNERVSKLDGWQDSVQTTSDVASLSKLRTSKTKAPLFGKATHEVSLYLVTR